MVIHKGNTYTISTDGVEARKSDGTTTAAMKYYPQRDAEAIAGEIDEATAWRILLDISRDAGVSSVPVSPGHILIDGDGFRLCEWSRSHDPRLTAPEGYSPVWALGASVFYLFLGCHIFQGLGGKGQTATTPVPTLRRNLPQLSGIIARCVTYAPADRPTLDEIAAVAAQNLDRSSKSIPPSPPLKKPAVTAITADDLDRFWPEEIC